MRFAQTEIKRFAPLVVVSRFRRQGDLIVGSDEKGAEVVRVPMREPVHIRPDIDAANKLVRINCP